MAPFQTCGKPDLLILAPICNYPISIARGTASLVVEDRCSALISECEAKKGRILFTEVKSQHTYPRYISSLPSLVSLFPCVSLLRPPFGFYQTSERDDPHPKIAFAGQTQSYHSAILQICGDAVCSISCGYVPDDV